MVVTLDMLCMWAGNQAFSENKFQICDCRTNYRFYSTLNSRNLLKATAAARGRIFFIIHTVTGSNFRILLPIGFGGALYVRF